jgi:hypothetical protein
MQKTTQSVIATNYNCNQNPKFIGLINLRKNPKTFNLIGRTNGDNIKFNQGLLSSYNDYKMRRKAEILQYKNNINSNSPGYTKTDNEIYTEIIKGNSANGYSKNRLQQILLNNNEDINCNRVISKPPSNSGIWFNDSSPEIVDGLYLDKNIKFYLRL